MIDVHPDHLLLVREILVKHVPSLEVRAFGSRVQGCAKRYSDLDLVLMTDEHLPPLTLARLEDAFQESDLSFRVDLVDWSSISEAFREIILQASETIQKKSVG